MGGLAPFRGSALLFPEVFKLLFVFVFVSSEARCLCDRIGLRQAKCAETQRAHWVALLV